MDRATRTPAPHVTVGPPGSFPWGVFHERHPALIDRLLDAFPYPAGPRRALHALLDETLGGVVEPLSETAHDHAVWAGEWDRGHYGKPWSEAPFLWAEIYFYRRLLEAVGYFGTGPWRGVDPFAPFKDAELATNAVDEELAALDVLAEADDVERTQALLHASLWGNRADLTFRITAADQGDGAGKLVADDRGELLRALRGRVVIVADNAGRELIPDLVLADHLLATGRADPVVLHVKPQPFFVSDATPSDVLAGLRRLAAAPGQAGKAGSRLWAAMGGGRLVVRAHPFACAPLTYEEMPGDLRREFAAASLTLFKGDLNYRRLVGDRHWPATTPFAEVTGHFPGPVAALRTLKSDVVVGVDPAALAALDATERPWRTSGAYAVVQAGGCRAEDYQAEGA